MKNQTLLVILLVVLILLAGELVFLLVVPRLPMPAPAAALEATQADIPPETETAAPAPQTEPETEPETVPETQPETEPETEPETQPETEPETEPVETEPEKDPNRFTLTFIGDCTLGSDVKTYGVMYSFIDTIGEDYDYPFRNVVQYFKDDDFTFANLEGTLYNETAGRDGNAFFTFRGPTAYTKILTGSSIEAVTLANNHAYDYGKQGYQSTVDALTEANVTFVEKDNYAMYTTERGLKIGLYSAAFTLNGSDAAACAYKMRQQGADVLIAALHWGAEGSYRQAPGQTEYAHILADAGYDIIYGSHPHVLQPIEEYKDSIIYYSMGNFCFGGNHWPPDLDSVVLQQEIIRDENGKCRLGELTRIPVSCSSLPAQNNFQPTPYEVGSEKYDRTLSKLDGTYKGGNLNVDYN